MKKTFSILLIAGAILAVSCQRSGTSESTQVQKVSLDTTQLKPGDVYYQCLMDKDVLSDSAGMCSKCGMALTRKVKQ